MWGHLGGFGEFGHVFFLISAANQSGGATRVALFYVPEAHAKRQIQSISTTLLAIRPLQLAE